MLFFSLSSYMWPFNRSYFYTIIWLANIHLSCSYSSLKVQGKLTVLTSGHPRHLESSLESSFTVFHTKSTSFVLLLSIWDRLTSGLFIAKGFIMYLDTVPCFRAHVLQRTEALQRNLPCPWFHLVSDSVYGIAKGIV